MFWPRPVWPGSTSGASASEADPGGALSAAGKREGGPFVESDNGSKLLPLARLRERADHPRVRGEDDTNTPDGTPNWGLPPRERGRLCAVDEATQGDGTTPARAGKTGTGFLPAHRPRDYPRASGEDYVKVLRHLSGTGLPPRERGRQRHRIPLLRRQGTTPARAGKTDVGSGTGGRAGDYPRASGEDGVSQPVGAYLLGLPPRERGRRPLYLRRARQPGTTPARAGKTRAEVGPSRRRRDYPRASGEDSATVMSKLLVWGLPPRERGRPLGGFVHGHDEGTTPARAGKTRGHGRSGLSGGDYPRASGEDAKSRRATTSRTGLPPRERGRPCGRFPPRRRSGTTPARAGKTIRRARGWSARRDYPRASGEDNPRRRRWGPAWGLPPRERGRLRLGQGPVAEPGTTPARAGKTPSKSRCCLKRRDYPRASGEDVLSAGKSVGCLGLPPRERGRRHPDPGPGRQDGTTPARAGKTDDVADRHRRGGDYPRASGEDLSTGVVGLGTGGLPPRERGRPW